MKIESVKLFDHSWLYLIVFLTGASVMVIELLGARMIAPFYGASLYVWSSLISVTMIALALGYFVGGRWADTAKRNGLALIIALAGLLTLLIPWVTRPILLATDPLGLRVGAFVSALVLFSPGLTMLGMVGPFAIKMATARLDGVGNSVGSIYAVSTLGSVVGTLILGFYLFPIIGSREILTGLGVVLMALGLLVAVYEKKRLGLSAILPVAVAVIGLCLLPKVVDAGHIHDHDNKFQIQSERESLYGWVRVIDNKSNNLRLLMSDASAIGAATISTSENLLVYQNIVKLIPAMQPNMTRALIIGLGAGHMARVLHDQYGIVTDTLEIDPAVADAAKQYFGFKATGLAVVGDARYEIRHLQGPYDLIIHDCFTGGAEPAHLLTVETLTQLRGLLSNQGILALNFVALLQQDQQSAALSSVSRTIEKVLPYQTVFISEPGKSFNDFIFLAANQPIDINAKTLLPQQMAWLQQRVFAVDKTQGVVLTDNLNPLEQLQTAKSEHYRRFVIDMFGPNLFVR